MRIPVALTIAACLFSAAARAADESFPIKIQRAYPPGKVFDIHATADISVDAAAALTYRNKSDSKSISYKAELTGKISNGKLDDAGDCKEFALSIAHLTDKGRDCIRPGCTVLVRYGVKTPSMTSNPLRDTIDSLGSFTYEDGTPIPDNAKRLLVNIFSGLHQKTGSLDDAVGSKTPRKVGESWKIDSAAAAPFISAELLRVPPFGLSGSTQLVSVQDSGGSSKTMRLTGKIVGDNFTTPYDPPQMVMNSSRVTFSFSAVLPLDPKDPPLQFDQTADAVANFGSVGGSVKGDLKVLRVVRITTTPAKEAVTTPAPQSPAANAAK